MPNWSSVYGISLASANENIGSMNINWIAALAYCALGAADHLMNEMCQVPEHKKLKFMVEMR